MSRIEKTAGSMARSRRLPVRARQGLFTLLCAFALSAPAWAEKADHDKPTHIDYDSSAFDDLHQVYVFRGHVILTKGTILIRCDKMVVTRDAENYDYGVATMDEPGKLVYFHQKREGFPDQYIEGVGERIEYDEKADLAKIFVKAVVRRLDGGVTQDEIRGDMIQYNSLTEQYVVQAGATGQRAHAEFAPAKKNDAPAAAAGPAKTNPATNPAASPAASPDVPATVPKPDPGEPLQPSLQLQTKPDE